MFCLWCRCCCKTVNQLLHATERDWVGERVRLVIGGLASDRLRPAWMGGRMLTNTALGALLVTELIVDTLQNYKNAASKPPKSTTRPPPNGAPKSTLSSSSNACSTATTRKNEHNRETRMTFYSDDFALPPYPTFSLPHEATPQKNLKTSLKTVTLC